MVITDVNQVVYNGDGINTAWPFTFRIIDKTDIKLLLINSNGAETNITSDYYVDMVNNTVYYPGYAPGAEPPEEDQPPVLAVGQKLVVYRELPITQEADLGDKWPFFVIELALDKLTMILQQAKDWWNRSVKVSAGTDITKFDTTISTEPNTIFAINEAGTGFISLKDPVTAAKEAAASAESAKDSADRAYRITPEALRWMENFVVGSDGKFYQVMEEE